MVAKKKTFKELPENQRNMVRALMEDVVLHGENISGFGEKDVSTVLKVSKESLAALKANITRRNN